MGCDGTFRGREMEDWGELADEDILMSVDELKQRILGGTGSSITAYLRLISDPSGKVEIRSGARGCRLQSYPIYVGAASCPTVNIRCSSPILKLSMHCNIDQNNRS
jgi:hypothetical protein